MHAAINLARYKSVSQHTALWTEWFYACYFGYIYITTRIDVFIVTAQGEKTNFENSTAYTKISKLENRTG